MPVTPELALPDPEEARAMLARVFGFVADGALMRLGNQGIALARGDAAGHGVIDHLALAVPDLDAAATAHLARGAQPDTAVTPLGPLEIPEFWAGGVRYLFLQGPGGARIELIENRALPHGPGHDHIGIPCTNIAASAAFLTGLGATPAATYRLHRPEGDTEVRFLNLLGTMIELYQPPNHRPAGGPGLWRRLLGEGLPSVTGPDGLTLAPI